MIRNNWVPRPIGTTNSTLTGLLSVHGRAVGLELRELIASVCLETEVIHAGLLAARRNDADADSQPHTRGSRKREMQQRFAGNRL